jgi:hypothetical protein
MQQVEELEARIKQLEAALDRRSCQCLPELSPQDAWGELVNKTDRTSPEEYPDHCLITFDELQDFMLRSRQSSPPKAIEREGYPKDAFINDYD